MTSHAKSFRAFEGAIVQVQGRAGQARRDHRYGFAQPTLLPF